MLQNEAQRNETKKEVNKCEFRETEVGKAMLQIVKNNPNKFGTGRYHMVDNAAENLHGHATQQELLVE